MFKKIIYKCLFILFITGFVIYQWDAHKRQILHRLDCSKLAPCSESLMSISIEDHFKRMCFIFKRLH